jgi:hypothetical protein
MNANSVHVKRTTTILRPAQTRVLLRPFNPGDSQSTAAIEAVGANGPEVTVL